MDVPEFLAEKASKTEQALDAYLNTWRDAPVRLVEAVRYSLFAGGKRLRPALALGAADLIAGDDAAALPAACAIEMIHTYSLIHDDLPAMDDDDLRRGRPTSHKVFGEATAILAGDALVTMAFDVLARTGNVDVVREVAQAAGVAGMVGGQHLDMEAEGRALTLEELRRIHAFKTGALIRVSMRAGAMLAYGAGGPCSLSPRERAGVRVEGSGANHGQDARATRGHEDRIEALTRYGEAIGLAFQIMDDILDVVGDERALGKRVGADAGHRKATYPALVGLERARELAVEARDAAIAALAGFGPEADAFRALARYIIERDR
ncbi:MAG TPA: polyprenyl synthetase family protein [Candidatus Hydrogenedentes bacterium]|nr:polyprenyl synthetase family protein [Candidatus Hydrogenedentota bacterium]HNT88462.1 polyprenyl synthetase family protein [Candidatus Hydrogenedentota bacterium]